jgi:hypothetical protein
MNQEAQRGEPLGGSVGGQALGPTAHPAGGSATFSAVQYRQQIILHQQAENLARAQMAQASILDVRGNPSGSGLMHPQIDPLQQLLMNEMQQREQQRQQQHILSVLLQQRDQSLQSTQTLHNLLSSSAPRFAADSSLGVTAGSNAASLPLSPSMLRHLQQQQQQQQQGTLWSPLLQHRNLQLDQLQAAQRGRSSDGYPAAASVTVEEFHQPQQQVHNPQQPTLAIPQSLTTATDDPTPTAPGNATASQTRGSADSP